MFKTLLEKLHSMLFTCVGAKNECSNKQKKGNTQMTNNERTGEIVVGVLGLIIGLALWLGADQSWAKWVAISGALTLRPLFS